MTVISKTPSKQKPTAQAPKSAERAPPANLQVVVSKAKLSPPRKTEKRPREPTTVIRKVLRNEEEGDTHSPLTTPTLAGTSSGLSFNNSKLEKLNAWKMRNNPYACTLVDPFRSYGVRIPDGSGSSITLSIHRRIYPSVDANGRMFWTWGLGGGPQTAGTSWAANMSYVNTAAMGPPMYVRTLNTSASATPIWNDAVTTYQGAFNVGGPPFTPTNVFQRTTTQPLGWQTWDLPAGIITFLRDNTRTSRVVSAGVVINTTASVTNNQGQITVASLPRGFFGNLDVLSSFSAFNTFDITNIDTYPGSVVYPMNKGAGITALYSPVDSMARQYVESNVQSSDLATTPEALPEAFRPGSMIVYGTGLASGTSFIFDIVLNLECQPSNNAVLNAESEAYPEDDMALEHADDIAKSMSNVYAGSALAMGQNDSSSFLSGKVLMAERGNGDDCTLVLHSPQKMMIDNGIRSTPSLAKKKDLASKIAGGVKTAMPYIRMADKLFSSLL